MHRDNDTEQAGKPQAWKSLPEISLSLTSGFDWQVENLIKERLHELSIPLANQQQINRAIRKVVNAAYEKSLATRGLDGAESIADMTIRVSIQSHGKQITVAGSPADDQARCWGFFLIESNTHQPQKPSDSTMHILDVCIYRE